MATLTKEQIKQKKEAGASELPDDALEQAAGGAPFPECVAHDISGIPPTPVL